MLNLKGEIQNEKNSIKGQDLGTVFRCYFLSSLFKILPYEVLSWDRSVFFS